MQRARLRWWGSCFEFEIKHTFDARAMYNSATCDEGVPGLLDGTTSVSRMTEAGVEDLEDLPDLVNDDIDNIPSAPFGGAECHIHDKNVC